MVSVTGSDLGGFTRLLGGVAQMEAFVRIIPFIEKLRKKLLRCMSPLF